MKPTRSLREAAFLVERTHDEAAWSKSARDYIVTAASPSLTPMWEDEMSKHRASPSRARLNAILKKVDVRTHEWPELMQLFYEKVARPHGVEMQLRNYYLIRDLRDQRMLTELHNAVALAIDNCRPLLAQRRGQLRSTKREQTDWQRAMTAFLLADSLLTLAELRWKDSGKGQTKVTPKWSDPIWLFRTAARWADESIATFAKIRGRQQGPESAFQSFCTLKALILRLTIDHRRRERNLIDLSDYLKTLRAAEESGLEERTGEFIRKLPSYVEPYNMTEYYGAAGQTEKGRHWLECACEILPDLRNTDSCVGLQTEPASASKFLGNIINDVEQGESPTTNGAHDRAVRHEVNDEANPTHCVPPRLPEGVDETSERKE